MNALLSRRRWLGSWLLLGLAGCADHAHVVVVSVPEQRLVLLTEGAVTAVYPVSTSRFGVGDQNGSKRTPLGALEIARKIGAGAAAGEKFKSREATGEVVPVDAPGRDPIVTRILWLRGLEPQNAHAFDRYIYIHGTPEERNIGRVASYGCVRMRSRDVIALFDAVGTGARVFIREEPLGDAARPYLAAGEALPAAAAPAPGLAPEAAEPAPAPTAPLP